MDKKETLIIVPKGEIIKAQYCKDGITTHIITTTISQEMYFMYEYNDGKLKKIDKNTNPLTFEKWR